VYRVRRAWVTTRSAERVPNCGPLTGNDNCGKPRTVASCGACAAPAVCGANGPPNVCGCPLEDDTAFCAVAGAACGSVTGTDLCGLTHAVASCGACAAPQVCGGAGAANRCAEPLDGAWVWQVPAPTGEGLRAVWSFGPSDVWAAGSFGTFVHWDGQSLALVPAPTTAVLTGLWGSAPDDLWAVGMQDETGPDPQDVFLHYDGSAWSQVPIPSSETGYLTAISGSGPADVWVLGEGTLVHWDGTAWNPWAGSLPEDAEALSFAAPNDAWAVGGGHAYHFDGMTWAPTVIGSPGDYLGSVFAAGPDDVWETGGTPGPALHGLVEHYDGTAWSAVPTTGMPSPAAPGGVWASASGDAWTQCTGPDGYYVCHFSPAAQSWTPYGVGFSPAIHGSAPDDVWAVGGAGQIARWDGTALTSLTAPEPDCVAVHGVSSSEVWVGCTGSLQHWDGSAWTSVTATLGALEQANGVWVAAVGDVWAATSLGRILHLAQGTWTATSPSSNPLLAISGTGPHDVWATDGPGGSLYHYDGTSWTNAWGCGEPCPSSLWADAPNDVWGLSVVNRAWHYDGAGWAPYALPPSCGPGGGGVYGLSSDEVWAVGGPCVLRWDASAVTWTTVFVGGTTSGFVSVWPAAPDDVFAVDRFGTPFHYNGVSWSAMPRATADETYAIWGAAPRDLFLVGTGIQRYQ
jgi:hypothetical protein